MQYSVCSLVEGTKNMKHLICSIFELPDQDNIQNIKKLILYLQQLLRVKTPTPPMVEIMIILQEEKPLLYNSARLSVAKNSHLAILFEIKGDYELSKKRFNDLVNNL